MKKLHFIYNMKLEFDSNINKHYYSLKCIPSNNFNQKIYSLEFNIKPSSKITEAIDGFNNKSYIGYYLDEHNFFEYNVSGIAWVDNFKKAYEDLNPCFKFYSQYTTCGRKITELYNNIMKKHGNNLERATHYMMVLKDYFSYESGTTNINTNAEEALLQGKGVCQDYSHILISICRLDNIPARYVAGLMIGEGFSHAWVEIYDNGYWYGLDPTNNKIVDDYYIKISHGRDYGDCIINKGVFNGATNQKQTIFASVKEL